MPSVDGNVGVDRLIGFGYRIETVVRDVDIPERVVSRVSVFGDDCGDRITRVADFVGCYDPVLG